VASFSVPNGSTSETTSQFSHAKTFKEWGLKYDREEVFNFNVEWSTARDEVSDSSSQNSFDVVEQEGIISKMVHRSIPQIIEDFSLDGSIKHCLNNFTSLFHVFIYLLKYL